MRLRALFLVIVCMSAASQAQDRTPDQRVYSGDKETALGTQLAAQVRRQTTPLNVTAADNYALNLGLRLAAQMPNASVDWKFSVIRDRRGGSTHEPISLPGGWIFIPSALFLAAQDASEFAAMIAHAMGHVAAKHMIYQSSGEASSLAAIPLTFMGPAGLGRDEDSRLVPVAFLERQRQFELEADRIAVRAASGAGFDPEALV
jgi:predicted Zn-dependent protease